MRFPALVLVVLVLLLPLGVQAAGLEIAVLDVRNMTCSVCPITVKKALERVPGVAEARVDFDRKMATVKFDPHRTRAAALVKATTAAGYPSRLRARQ